MKNKKTILISGGNGYLAKEFIKSCDSGTTNFILVDIHDTSNIQKDNITYYKCDLADVNERNSLILKLKNKKINVLINNAAFVGTSNLKGWNTDFEKQSLDTWKLCFEVNVTAVFHLCRELFPILKKSSNSSIINISSMYGSLKHNKSFYKDLDMSVPAAYSASKGALNQLTKWLSVELAPFTRVNALSPGGIFRNQDKVFIDRYESQTLMGRMATEKDIVGAMKFLVSEDSNYITGEIININGGVYL